MQCIGSSHNVDIAALWIKSSEVLRSRLDPQLYSAWIKPLSLSTRHGESVAVPREVSPRVELVAPNKFCRDHVERHYRDMISRALCDVIGSSEFSLFFRSQDGKGIDAVRPKTDNAHARRPQRTSPAPARTTSIKRSAPTQRKRTDEANLNTEYNFSNYVVGSCNQFAHAASLKVAENPGKTYNPFFVYGGVGLGKTHLVNAIGNAARRRGKKVLLVSSELFVNELIHSLRTNNMQQFKSKFRSIDLLIIDDVQFIIGKERTQEEFFHTFNELHQRGKQIVITSDKVPQELTGLEERLRTRFSSGLSADLQTPDFETRVAILNKKAERLDIAIPADVAEFLAEKVDTNIRELEGALNRIQAMSSLSSTTISLDLAQSALSSLLPSEKREITTEMIQQAVAAKFNVSIGDLLGKRRTQNIALARHVAMYLCRKLTGRSYPEIGAVFGGRDHSTAIHACKKLEDCLSQDSALSSQVASLENQLTG